MARRKPRTMGRPIKLADEQVLDRFLDAVRNGTPLTHAAVAAGVARRTLFQTLERGEEADLKAEDGERLTPNERVDRRIYLRIQEARAQVAVRNVELVQRVAEGGQLVRRRTIPSRSGDAIVEEEFAQPDWRAAKFLLQASFKGEFVDTHAQQVELSGPGGGPVQVEDESVRRVAERVHAELQRSPEDDVVDAEVVEVVDVPAPALPASGPAAGWPVNGSSNGHVNGNGHGLNGHGG